MPDSYPFPTYSGLLEPKHYKQIGSALWLFLWCVSSTTKDIERDGVAWGLVLGNKPIKISELVETFGVTDKTVRSWIKTLETNEYIKVTRAPYGLIFTVRNSKKYKGSSVENNRSGSEENYRSPPTDRKKTTDHSEENYRSNKDIIKILIDRLIDGLGDDNFLKKRCGVPSSAVGSFSTGQIHLTPEIVAERAEELEAYFNQRKARLFRSNADFEHVQAVANEAIPLDFALLGIDLAFAKHEKFKKHAHQSIRTFAYCKTVIFEAWNEFTTGYDVMTQKRPVPLAGRGPSRNKNQQQMDELQTFIEEEKKREQARSS